MCLEHDIRSLLITNAGKTYTIVLKDELLPVDPKTGRDQATTSWEYDFAVGEPIGIYNQEVVVITIPWADFKPTYRGKPKPNAGSLNIANIKRLSFMMRR